MLTEDDENRWKYIGMKNIYKLMKNIKIQVTGYTFFNQ